MKILTTAIDNLLENLVYIPESSFSLGSSLEEVEKCVEYWSQHLVESCFTKDNFRQWILKEYPNHQVTLSSFWLSRFPVTNAEYACFVAETNHPQPESIQRQEPANHPVWGVSRKDAETFCNWLNSFSDRTYRLPTEAEWEYAAKGTSGREYPFGDSFNPACGNTVEAGIGHTTPVDHYAKYASEFGICDLAGNVEEWTSSNYSPYPGGEFIADDLVTALGADYPILRGGSFLRGGDLARSARRHGPYPAPAYKYTGFRLAI